MNPNHIPISIPERIRKMIAKNHVKRAIDNLMSFTEYLDPSLHKDMVVQSSNFEKLESDKRLGKISTSDEETKYNRIISALLDINSEIETHLKKKTFTCFTEIHIQSPFSSWNLHLSEQIIERIADILDSDSSQIKIVLVFEGSIRIFLQIPQKGKKKLLSLYNNPTLEFKDFVQNLEINEILSVCIQDGILKRDLEKIGVIKQQEKIDVEQKLLAGQHFNLSIISSHNQKQVTLNDTMTRNLLKLHQGSSVYRMHRLFDKVLINFDKDPNSFNMSEFFGSVYTCLLRSRNLVKGFKSASIGDIFSFCDEHFPKSNLEKYVNETENILLGNIDPVVKRRMLLARVRVVQEASFAEMMNLLKDNSDPIIINLDKYLTGQLMKLHNAYSAYGMYIVIDEVLSMIEIDPRSYREEDLTNKLFSAISKSRNLCRGFENEHLGNLFEFISQKFPKEELKKYITQRASLELFNDLEPLLKRRIVLDYIRNIQHEIFDKFGDYFKS